MSRNTATLICPKCGHYFTQDCLKITPVCPECQYSRDGNPDKPKFTKVEG